MLQPFAILHPLLSRSESSDRIGTSTYRKMYKDNSQIAACHTRWGSRSNRSEGCDEKLRTSPMESFPSYSESVQFGIFWCFCFCICVAVLQSSFIGPKTFQTQPRDTTPALRHMRCRRADKLVGSSQQKLGGLALKLLQVSKNVAKGGTSYLHNFAYDIWHHLRFHQISLEFLSCLIHFDPFWSISKELGLKSQEGEEMLESVSRSWHQSHEVMWCIFSTSIHPIFQLFHHFRHHFGKAAFSTFPHLRLMKELGVSTSQGRVSLKENCRKSEAELTSACQRVNPFRANSLSGLGLWHLLGTLTSQGPSTEWTKAHSKQTTRPSIAWHHVSPKLRKEVFSLYTLQSDLDRHCWPPVFYVFPCFVVFPWVCWCKELQPSLQHLSAEGKDVMLTSTTGSGKTLAFLLPLPDPKISKAIDMLGIIGLMWYTWWAGWRSMFFLWQEVGLQGALDLVFSWLVRSTVFIRFHLWSFLLVSPDHTSLLIIWPNTNVNTRTIRFRRVCASQAEWFLIEDRLVRAVSLERCIHTI